jgi:hypothetical protein
VLERKRRARRVIFRAFTTVELIVSVALFLTIATFTTLVIATALGEGAQTQRTRASSEAVSDMLAVLSSYSYTDVLENTFTVPSPCNAADEGAGIAGTSCVNNPSAVIRVGYFYADSANSCPQTTAGSAKPAGVQTASTLAQSQGTVGVCAIATESDGTVSLDAFTQRANVNVPWKGFASGQSQVRVAVASTQGVSAQALYLVAESSPATLVNGPASIANGVAVFSFTASSTQCTDLNPCQVALSPSATSPAQSASVGVFGAAARPGAGILNREGYLTSAAVTLAPVASATVSIAAAGVAPSTPQAGKVCLWGTLDSAPDVPVLSCNAPTPANVVFSTFAHSLSPAGVTYPLSVGDRVRVSVDSPSGVCNALIQGSDGADNWSPQRVCTSWVWGYAPDVTAVASVVPSSSAALAFNSSSPASGAGVASPWTKPRATLSCAADFSCAPAQRAPELELCPGELCLSSAP